MKDNDELGKQLLEHLKLYQDLGVRWVRVSDKPKRQPRPAPAKAKVQGTIENAEAIAAAAKPGESLDAIRADIGDCRRCKLAAGRKNIVFGSGNPKAELMFVGEAPGADEDEQGLPFVGRAGQLLTRIIESIGIDRKDVFICNILKCRPPGNRNPETDEIAACEQFLFRQIAAVRPKIICALGAFGAQTLLRKTEAIGRLRGSLLDYRGAKLIATFHPAYLLRNPYEKRKVWEDMRVIRKYLDSLR
jgi:uracil-DNA glycosylase